MKRFFQATSFLFCLLYLSAQNFAPVGAKWHYTEKFAFSGDISYLSIESVGDTLIKGRTCRILANNGGLFCAFNNTHDYVYEEDSAVYFYEPEIDSFQILYDLKVQPNDNWTVIYSANPEKLDTANVKVDSIGKTIINRIELKILYVTYNSMNKGFEDWSYFGTIIEKIGDTNYLFNLHGLSGIYCDGNYSGGLRCYEDSEIGFYSTGIADSCTYTYKWTGSEEISQEPFCISPNPTNGVVRISAIYEMLCNVEVFNVSGQKVLNRDINLPSEFDMSVLKKGTYLIVISNGDKVLAQKINLIGD